MAADELTASPDASHEERAWLQAFLNTCLAGNIVVSVLSVTVFLQTLTPASGMAATLFIGYNAMLLWARSETANGNIRRVGLLLHSSILVVSIVMAVLFPQDFAVMLFGPLFAAAVCLPYLSPRDTQLALIGSWLAALLITLIAQHVAIFPPSPWLGGIPLLLSVVHIIGMTLLVLWRYHSRLMRLLTETRRGNDALSTMKAKLELMVATRTAELAEREASFKAISELTSDYSFCMQAGPDGTLHTAWVTEAFTRVLGYSAAEFDQAGGMAAIAHPEDLPIVLRRRERVLANKSDISEFRVICRNGEIRWLRAYTRPEALSPDGQVTRVLGAIQDISERKQHLDQIERLAFSDELTGLANRRLWQRSVAALLDDAPGGTTPLAVLYLDLNRFKTVNDALGHHIGDSLLAQVAGRLRASVRSGDLLARLGGDEFAILLEGAGEDEARQIATRIHTAFEPPIMVNGHILHAEACIGIACFPRDGLSSVELLRCADIAMYYAKQQGLRTQSYEPALWDYREDHLRLEADLRAAIAADSLTLFFQPIYDLETGLLMRAEALLRWQPCPGHWVSPATIIRVAEEGRLIRDLDRWVICAAMRQVARWSVAGLTIPVAINISANSLQDAGLGTFIREARQHYGVAPELITFELTESAAMRNMAQSRELLQSLRAAGFSIALDDFGQGHASLAYLKDLPVDVLKVDRAFVRGIGEDARDEGLLRAMLTLGCGLGLTVVAEGIESEQHQHWLREAGYHLGQGFHLGRPMPPEELFQLTSHRYPLLPAHSGQPVQQILTC